MWREKSGKEMKKIVGNKRWRYVNGMEKWQGSEEIMWMEKTKRREKKKFNSKKERKKDDCSKIEARKWKIKK